jgi:hypothetical protein
MSERYDDDSAPIFAIHQRKWKILNKYSARVCWCGRTGKWESYRSRNRSLHRSCEARPELRIN